MLGYRVEASYDGGANWAEVEGNTESTGSTDTAETESTESVESTDSLADSTRDHRYLLSAVTSSLTAPKRGLRVSLQCERERRNGSGFNRLPSVTLQCERESQQAV